MALLGNSWGGCLSLVTISVLFHSFAIQRSVSATNGDNNNLNAAKYTEEFPHLLKVAEKSGKIHLISELVRNGRRLQLEEYLDLSSWSQLIQFKWHEDTSAGFMDARSLTTQRISALIMNQERDKRKVMMQYEPYKCFARVLEPLKEVTGAISSWRQLLESSLGQKVDDKSVSVRQRHTRTIETILSTATDNPYFAKVPLGDAEDQAWVFGVAGLWLKAQFPLKASQLGHKTRSSPSGAQVQVPDVWSVNSRELNLNVTYHLNGVLLNSKSKSSNVAKELLYMVELSNFYKSSDKAAMFDYLNVVAVNLDFGGKPAENLFRIPVGYNCPSNPALTRPLYYFENMFYADSPSSKLVELELAATKLKGLLDTKLYSSTDIKSISVATTKHPASQTKSLVMFHTHEDKYKTIRDYNNMLSYTIHSRSIYCNIEKLQTSSANNPHHTLDPLEIYFNNGITLTLSVRILGYLFNSTQGDENEMRFLSQNSVSKEKLELVFESRVPQELEYLLAVLDASGRSMKQSITIVRVYEQLYVAPHVDGNLYKMKRRGPMTLARIILLVYNQERNQKLAELKINLFKVESPLSFTRRAHIFDITNCYKPEEQSMQLTVTYPGSQFLRNEFESKSEELIEEFYSSPLDWWTVEKSNSNREERDLARMSNKKKLDMSLNFLRVPRVELVFNHEGDLELRFKLIDKPSPLHSFEELENSNFLDEEGEERLLVSSADECAQFCEFLHCKVFAYDRSIFECKLSHKRLDVRKQDNENNENNLKAVHRNSSKLYVMPTWRPDESWEASLAEIVSYIEHSADDNDYLDNIDYEESFETPESRAKREVSIERAPVMSFRYTDRSGGEYSPPVRRLLIPSQIRMSNIPITLDVSQKFQTISVLSAFKTEASGKGYQNKVLSTPAQKDPKMKHSPMSDEHSYINRLDSAYYTLKELHFAEVEQCELMCYNIEDWDLNSGGEQTCVSFSYCSFAKHCSLLIKTDFDYSVRPVKGLRLEEEQNMAEIKSLDELVWEELDCSIKTRSHLSGYKGPIKLPDNVFGYASTNKEDFGLEYEWLRTYKIESSKQTEDAPEKCALQCLKQSKLGELCLAFDYCTSKNPTPVGQASTVYGESCHLFKVLNFRATDQSKVLKEITNMRYHLTRLKSNKDSSIKNATVHSCNRYLTSHLSEYNHIRHRKLTSSVRDKLKLTGEPLENVNINDCVSACSTRGAYCQAFEFCSSFDSKNMQVDRRCSLFSGGSQTIGANSDDKEASELSLTEQSNECHIYLRSQMKSLPDLLEFKPANIQRCSTGDMSFIVEHRALIISFSIVYIAIVILTVAYIKSKWLRGIALNSRERCSNFVLYVRETCSRR